MLLCVFIYIFFSIFVVFHQKICAFIVIIISFFEKVSYFCNRLWANHKLELVFRNVSGTACYIYFSTCLLGFWNAFSMFHRWYLIYKKATLLMYCYYTFWLIVIDLFGNTFLLLLYLFLNSELSYSCHRCIISSNYIVRSYVQILCYGSLREKCPCLEVFWSVFSRIRTEYGENFCKRFSEIHISYIGLFVVIFCL